MHELFVTTHVVNEDLDITLRILQGYCSSYPKHVFTRSLSFQGPLTRAPKPIDPNLIKQQPPQKFVSWKSLSDQLSRQSYILNVSYEIDQDEFGRTEDSGDAQVSQEGSQLLDQRFGTLRWNDLPEPTAAKPVNSRLPDPGLTRPVNSRLVVNIDNQQGLCTIMKKLQHTCVREIIQEKYMSVNGDILFELTRYLLFPTEPAGAIRATLPAFNTLTPFDAENKWILTASILVAKGDNPQQMKKGMDQLVAVKNDFEGCFDFKALDRHIFDTRVKM
ncbi:hypothetical protein LZ554_007541 [Drepanopeziza brunnea f. sp. 'monogermtubi']|nr:hypothetical protein LZ554_007541 [Drepanopeziza brunnea f. sp. 'monogermtubi']